MSHRRVAKPFDKAPQGQCRWCGEPIVHQSGEKRGQPDRRRRWHEECAKTYLIANNPTYTRNEVMKRDKGICAGCGVDVNWLEKHKRKLIKRVRGGKCTEGSRCTYVARYTHDWRHPELCRKHRNLLRGFIQKYGKPSWNSCWQADHIVPLIDGGGHGMDNLQLLCDGCHRKKTAQEATDRARKRKGQIPLFMQKG